MIEFSPENERFLESAIASGAFPNREEAVDRAVALLRERQETLQRLRQARVPLPELPPLLVRDDAGYVSLRGHRIGLHLLLGHLFAGEDATQIQDRFSSLTHEQVAAVLTFARQHEREMRAYWEQREAIDELLYETGRRGPSLAELRARWQAKFGQPLSVPRS